MEVSEMEERKIGQIKEELKAATEAMLPIQTKKATATTVKVNLIFSLRSPG